MNTAKCFIFQSMSMCTISKVKNLCEDKREKKKNILKFWQLKNTKRISNVNYLNIRNFCSAGNDEKFNEFLENQMAHLSKYLLSLREIFPVRKQRSVFHTDESAELRIQVKSRLICPCCFIEKCCCCFFSFALLCFAPMKPKLS